MDWKLYECGEQNKGIGWWILAGCTFKTVSIKDIDGNSILKLICSKIIEEDVLFIDFK